LANGALCSPSERAVCAFKRPTIDRIDSWVGQDVAGAIRTRHRRRLERARRLEQLEPLQDGQLWCAGDPPPREGCEREVLLDGAQALPRIAEMLARARSHVHIAGWYLTPDFGLTRNPGAVRLRDLLGELAEKVDVRVLPWAGAPLPVFRPARRTVQRTRKEIIRGTRVLCASGAPDRLLVDG
jgi:hypothetical protein